MDSFRSSRPTSKKLRFLSVASVISVGEEVPMGNFGRSSIPDAIDNSETDNRFESLPAIWARDLIRGPMFHNREGESVLPECLGPDPVPLNTGESLEIPGEVRPKSPQGRVDE